MDARIEAEVAGPGTLGVLYVFTDPASGRLIKSGTAERTGGTFTVSFSGGETGALAPGLYQLTLTVFSDALSTVAERTLTIEAAPPGSIPSVLEPQPTSEPGDQPSAGDGTPAAPTAAPVAESNGGCSVGGATADMGLVAMVALGLIGTTAMRRRRRE